LKRTTRRKLSQTRFSYTGIRVWNMQRSLRFYKKVMRVQGIHRGRTETGGIFVQLRNSRGHQRLELNYYPAKTEFHEPYSCGSELDNLSFWTSNVDEQFSRIIPKGGKIAVRPFSEGGFRLAFVRAPDGI
jgi:catechol 2,3-dioxygenase-like lactoylglutathione lyase family enzyme